MNGTIALDRAASNSGTKAQGGGRALSSAEVAPLFNEFGLASLDPQLRWGSAPAAAGAPPAAPGAPATSVTITDLARFLPASAVLRTEPNGWAVVGVPANFWVEATAMTVSGELLGQAAQVRFTPQAYRFDYGDGTSRTTASPGASWAALGQQELTATATSHVYRERADRRASVTVLYSSEYRFAGGPWIGVAGAVSGTAPQQRVLVVVERTALTRLG